MEAKEQKQDSANNDTDTTDDLPTFTFGTNSNGPPYTHLASGTHQKISVTPSFSKRQSKSANSITFSSTVSLYTDTEKRQNSLLFYDLWGVPATGGTRSRLPSDADSLRPDVSAGTSPDNDDLHQQITDIDMNLYHGLQQSTSLSAATSATSSGGLLGQKTQSVSSASGIEYNRKPSTLLTGPIKEEPEDADEEWSGFEVHHSDDDEELDADDEDSEYVYDNKKKKGKKKISARFRYRKRKSTVTADFIFGKASK